MRKTSYIARNYILCERLLQYGVLAGTTARTREGSDFNMSESPEAYATRLGLWFEDFGFDQAYRNRRIFFLHLVHGTHVLHVNAEAIPSGSFVQRCDGLVTGLHASPRVLTVKTADGVPVLLFDRSTCASGLVHCGWRGLRDRVLSGALRNMFESYSCRPPQLLLHMGPSFVRSTIRSAPKWPSCFLPPSSDAEAQRTSTWAESCRIRPAQVGCHVVTLGCLYFLGTEPSLPRILRA